MTDRWKRSRRTPLGRRKLKADFAKRTLRHEQLECRLLFSGFWHNEGHPRDVSDDGLVTALDALLVINAINSGTLANEHSRLPDPTPSRRPPPFVDVNDDGFLSPSDALVVINTFVLDRTPPEVSARLETLTSGSNVYANMPVIVGTVHDQMSGASSLSVTVDGGEPNAVAISRDGSFRVADQLSSAQLIDGEHHFDLVATDVVGNESSVTRLTFTLDRAGPKAIWNIPQDQTDVFSRPRIEIEFSEAVTISDSTSVGLQDATGIIELRAPDQIVSGEVVLDASRTRLTYLPSEDLKEGREFTIELGDRILDAVGNIAKPSTTYLRTATRIDKNFSATGYVQGLPVGSRVVALNAPDVDPAVIQFNGAFEFSGAPTGRLLFEVEIPKSPDSTDDFVRSGIFIWRDPQDYPWIYLYGPDQPIQTDNFIPLSTDQTTTVTNVAELPGWSLSLSPAAVVRTDGLAAERIRMIGVVDRLVPLGAPPGAEAATTVFVDVEGGDAVFGQPASIIAPNEGEFAAGTKMYLWAFDTSRGQWSPVAEAAVSDDGQTIETLPGQGARFTGLHVFLPLQQATVTSQRTANHVSSTGRIFYRVQPENGTALSGWVGHGNAFDFNFPSETKKVTIEAADPVHGLYGRQEWIVSDAFRAEIPPIVLESVVDPSPGAHSLDPRIAAILEGLNLPAEELFDRIQGIDSSPIFERFGELSRLNIDVKDIAVGDGYLYVASGERGLSIVDVSQATNPVLISQTSGSSAAVWVAARGTRVAVLYENGDVRVLDVSDPRSPATLLPIEGRDATVAALYGEILLINDGPELLSFNLQNGNVVHHESTNCEATIDDLDIVGEYVHALCRSNVGFVVDTYWIDGPQSLGPGILRHQSRETYQGISPLDMQSRRGSLAAGEYELNLADLRGLNERYETYQIITTTIPTEEPDLTAVFRNPALDAAQDGAGLAAYVENLYGEWRLKFAEVATIENGSPYWSPLTVTSPELQAVAMARGLAYIGGPLSIVRYDQGDGRYDLQFPFRTQVTGATYFDQQSVVSIHVLPHQVFKTDHVALVYQGNVVATDSSFPFDLDFAVPANERSNAAVDLSVRVVLRSGEVTNYPLHVSIEGVPGPTDDGHGPKIVESDPKPAARKWDVNSIIVRWDESLDKSKFSLNAATLSEAGADKNFGTTDDVAVKLSSFVFATPQSLDLRPSQTLSGGKYRLRIGKENVVDVTGNLADQPFTVDFEVAKLLDAKASSGTPHRMDQASANPGQRIGVSFIGAGSSTRMIFAIQDQSGEAGTREVLPVSTLSNVAYFTVPADATTGDVRVSGVDGTLRLQVVPILDSATNAPDEMSSLTVRGSGFVEHAMQVEIGGQLAYEVVPQNSLHFGKIVNELPIQLSTSVSGSISVVTAGGESKPLTFPAEIHRVVASADSGTPAVPSQPSANPGQRIQILGRNLTADTLIHFSVVDHWGTVSRRFIRPISVNANGNEMTVEVPGDAETGEIGLVGESVGPLLRLQVVPVLTNVRFQSVGRLDSGSRVIFEGRFVTNKSKYHFGSATVIDAEDNFDVVYDSYTGDAHVPLPLTQDFSGPIIVETEGGVSAPFAPRFDQIESAAISGTPADPLLPSANAGQALVLSGNGFTMQSGVLVEYWNGEGNPVWQVLKNISVSAAGDRLVVMLVDDANGVFPLRMLGASNAPVLQVVPVLNAVSDSSEGMILNGSGFVEGQNSQYEISGTTLSDQSTTDLSINVSPWPFASLYDTQNRVVVLSDSLSVNGTVRVSTVGGTSNSIVARRVHPALDELVDIAADGRFAVTSNRIYQVDPATGQRQSDWTLSDRDYTTAAVQLVPTAFQLGDTNVPAGSLLVLRNYSGCRQSPCTDIVQAIDSSSGNILATLNLLKLWPDHASFYDVAFHPTEKQLYFLTFHSIVIVDSTSGEFVKEFELPAGYEAIEVDSQTGNLWLGGRIFNGVDFRGNLVEMTSDGEFVRSLDLSPGSALSSIRGLGQANDQIWISGYSTWAPFDLTPTDIRSPQLDRIDSHSLGGSGKNLDVASANVSQPIELVGQNFSSKTRVRFPARDEYGYPYVETVTPTFVSPDGDRLQVIVPQRAETGDVTIDPVSDLAYWGLVHDKDYAIHRQISVPLRSDRATANISFQTQGLVRQWGIDNVRIAPASRPDQPLVNENFEGLIKDSWERPQLNIEGQGFLTRFSGPFTANDQSLIIQVTPGEDYVLTFDFYAIEPWQDPFLPGVTAPIFAVLLNDEVIHLHPRSADDPDNTEHKAPDLGRAALQIVPTITSITVNPSERGTATFFANGTGFVEGGLEISVGGIRWNDRFQDPPVQYWSQFEEYFADGNVSRSYFPPYDVYEGRSPTAVFGPVAISTAGGTFTGPEVTYQEARFQAPRSFAGVSLQSVAALGTPADSNLPSANVGQNIVFTGPGSDYTTVLFDAVNELGVLGEIAVTGSWVDGTLTVPVPSGARSGAIRFVGDQNTSLPLQIVPTLNSRSSVSEGEPLILEGTGFVFGSTTVAIENQAVSVTRVLRSDARRHLLETSVPVGVKDGAITVTTDGGSFVLATTIVSGPKVKRIPALTGITAVADSGLPRWNEVASAVVGQTITLLGRFLNKNLSVLFTADNAPGFIAASPIEVSADGTRMTIKVPTGATTGGVRLAGDRQGQFLQVVPTVHEFRWKEGIDPEKKPARILGDGFVARNTALHVGATRFSDTTALGNWFVSDHELQLPWPRELESGPLRIETIGGISDPLGVALTEIVAVAKSGTPAELAVPSAIGGQTITIRGQGLHSRSAIRFAGREPITVTPSRVISDTEIEVVVPVDAATGYVSLLGAEDGNGQWLQIVPHINRLEFGNFSDYSKSLVVLGSGFGTTFPVAYVIGTETGYVLPQEDTTVLDSTILKARWQNAGLHLGPISVTTSGGTGTYVALFDGVEGVAASGQPNDHSIPSANPKQKITIRGRGLANDAAVLFRYTNSAGFPSWEARVISDVSADNTTGQVEIPAGANGITLVVVPGASVAYPLQIVPTLDEFRMDSWGNILVGRGFLEGNDTTYDFHGATLIDRELDASPIDVVEDTTFSLAANSVVRLPTPVFGRGGGLTVRTIGGTSETLPLDVTSTGLRAITAVASGNYVVSEGNSILQIDLATGEPTASFTAKDLGLDQPITSLLLLTDDIASMNGSPVAAGSLLVFSRKDFFPFQQELTAFDPRTGTVSSRLQVIGRVEKRILAFDAVRQKILLTDEFDFFEIDANSGTLNDTDRFGSVGVYQDAAAVHPVTGNIWVARYTFFSEFMPDGRFVRNIPFSPPIKGAEKPISMAFDSDGSAVLAFSNGVISAIPSDGFALRADSTSVRSSRVMHVDELQMNRLAAEAIQTWDAHGLTDTQKQQIAETKIEVRDLPGNILGWTSGTTIYVDQDAAGWGWYFDSTPGDDTEFSDSAVSSDADHAIDMFTVLLHEFAHRLGHLHDEALGELLQETLSPGMRWTIDS